MLFDERLAEAVAGEHRRQLAEGLRHCEFDLPRRGLLARWRARRAATPAPSPVTPPAPEAAAPLLPMRSRPTLTGIRRTMPDMYR
jgi:hypothetical protein